MKQKDTLQKELDKKVWENEKVRKEIENKISDL